MLYFANKILEKKDKLVQQVAGTYTQQFEEINKASGMEVYNTDNQTSYEEALSALEEIK